MQDDGINCSQTSYLRGDPVSLIITCPTGYKQIGSGTSAYCGNGPSDKPRVDAIKTCPNGYENWGEQCYPICKPGFRAEGTAKCVPNGGPGIKLKLYDRYYCDEGEELYGAKCYPKCRENYKAINSNICMTGGDVRVKDIYNTDNGFQVRCTNGKFDLSTGACYSMCPSGYYENILGSCAQKCPLDTADAGTQCIRRNYKRDEIDKPHVPYSIYTRRRKSGYASK